MRKGAAAVAICLGLIAASCTNATETTSTSADESDVIVDGEIDIQGHRGARGLRPESTLPSFETALDLGVATLEFDLHFTSDGEVVVWHDPVISSDKCGLKPGAPDTVPDPDDPENAGDVLAVRALSVDQLRWLNCDRNPEPDRFPDQTSDATVLAGDDYGVVTLTDLLVFVDQYSQSELKTDAQRSAARVVHFNIETKRDPSDATAIGDGFDGSNAGAFELGLLAAIDAHGVEDRVVVQSFDERSLTAIHAEDPTIELAFLTSSRFSQFSAIVDAGVSVWSPRAATLTETLINDAHTAGLSVATWTVNSAEEIRTVAAMGVDAVITDRPDIALDALDQA